MRDILKFLTLGSIVLISISACGTSPEEKSSKPSTSVQPQQEILEKKIEQETQKIAKILQKTGEKLQKMPKNNLIEGEKRSKDTNFLNNKHKLDKDPNSSEVPDIARFQEEALKSIQKDPLYQALSVLEALRTLRE